MPYRVIEQDGDFLTSTYIFGPYPVTYQSPYPPSVTCRHAVRQQQDGSLLVVVDSSITFRPRPVRTYLHVIRMPPSKDSANGTVIPPILAPSVETAYKTKCIALRRRMLEVEEVNDAARLRKVRLERSIRKMRLERAILLESLAKRMRQNGSEGLNGVLDEDSEGSSDGAPPTPEERPLRLKRAHRRPGPSPSSLASHIAQQIPPAMLAAAGGPFNSSLSVPLATQHIQPYSMNGLHSTPAANAPYSAPASAADTNDPRPLTSTGAHPRPLLPKGIFVQHMLVNVIPSQPDKYPVNGVNAKEYCDLVWKGLPEEDRARWVAVYEQQMAEWTRAEDARKRGVIARSRRERRESMAGPMEGIVEDDLPAGGAAGSAAMEG